MLKIKIKKVNCGCQDEATLDEGRKEDAIKKYSSDPKRLEAIEYFTGSPIANNKYLTWMLQHLDEAPSVEEMQLAISKYDSIQKNIEKDEPIKDIGKITSFEELNGVIQDYSKSIRELEKEGQNVIVSKDETGGRFEVIRPMNVYASCEIGKMSRWCISATKSKNYYKSYTKRGVVFYTIIDYSKPQKDENSMFTYAIVQGMESGQVEIFNSVDKKINRADVAKLIGADNEASFYSKMTDESSKKIKSTTIERYNTFFARLMRWIKNLPKQLTPENESEYNSQFEEVQEEVDDFYSDWADLYRSLTSPPQKRRDALRQMVSFAKKATKIDNNIVRHKIGTSIRNRFSGIAQLVELVPDLMRDPQWLMTASKKFANLQNQLLNLDNYIDQEKFQSLPSTEVIKDFVEQSMYNNKEDYIDKLYKLFRSVKEKLNSVEDFDSYYAIYKIDNYRQTLVKTSIAAGYDGAKQFLFDRIDDTDSIPGMVSTLMHDIFKTPATLKQFGPDVLDYAIRAIKKSEGDEKSKKLDTHRLAGIIVRLQGLDKKYYNYSIENGGEMASVHFANHHDINILDLPMQEKVANYIIEYVKKHSGVPSAEYGLSIAAHAVLKSKSLPKEMISELLQQLFSVEKLYKSLHRLSLDEIIDMWGRDPQINAPAFERYLEKNKLKETRLYYYNKDYGVYGLIS